MTQKYVDVEMNKKHVLDYIENVWMKLDASAVHRYKRPDFIDHLHGGKTLTKLEDFEAWLAELFKKLPGPIESKLLLIVGEGDYVVTQFRAKLPLPPSGELKDTTIIDIYRFQDGMIAEHWDQHS